MRGLDPSLGASGVCQAPRSDRGIEQHPDDEEASGRPDAEVGPRVRYRVASACLSLIPGSLRPEILPPGPA